MRALSENEKDYGNPTFRLVYAALSLADLSDPKNEIINWLNRNGFANLTCCPECHVDDFTHVEGCRFADKLPYVAGLADVLESLIDSPIGLVKMDKQPKNLVNLTVRRLREALGETQQEFAARLHLAISTVVRYEISRPPRGKALAQLAQLATAHGLDECAQIFGQALNNELGLNLQPAEVRPPRAGTSGFLKPWTETPEEDAMMFDVLALMRSENQPAPPNACGGKKGDPKGK